MIALFATLGHVPTYTNDGCVNNCCVPGSLDYNLSQVLYLKGSGGLEIPLDNANPVLHYAQIPYEDRVTEINEELEQRLKIGAEGNATRLIISASMTDWYTTRVSVR